MTSNKSRGPIGFKIIGVLKIVGAVLMTALGLGIFRMIGGDVGATLTYYVSRLHLDPDSRYLHFAISKIGGIDERHLKELGLGAFAYAILHVIEGTGLLLHRRWAEYLTVIITASLLPLEAYEIIRKMNRIKVLVLVVNLAILVYLIVKLWQERPGRDEPKAEPSPVKLELD